MPKNRIEDLRNHLFEALEALKDKDAPMEIDRAKAVCLVAEKIIGIAKVEVQYAEVTGEILEGTFFGKPGLPQSRLPQIPDGKPNGKLRLGELGNGREQ